MLMMMVDPARKKAAAAGPVTIFEDGSEEATTQDQKAVGVDGPSISRSTLLSKRPAKRAPGMISSGIIRPQNMRRQLHGGPVARPYQTSMSNVMPSTGTNIGSTVRKPPRRQTIFMPEDTTVMSIHPGPRDNTSRIEDSFHLPNIAVQREQQSQSRNNSNLSQEPARGILHAPAVKAPPRRQSFFVPQEPTAISNRLPADDRHKRVQDTLNLSNLEIRQVAQSHPAQDDIIVKQKLLRRPRQSLLAPPKRLPLRESTSTENMPGWDLAGANTGKENIPPAGQDVIEKGMMCLNISDQPSSQARRQSIQPRMRSSLYAPTQASQHRQIIVARDQAQLAAGIPKPARPIVSFKEPSPEPYDWRSAVIRREEEVKKVREFVASKRNEQQTARLRQYPVLEGELSEPALYEDKWLSYQETALTEAINGIFEVDSPAWTIHDDSLMEQLISLYNRPETTLVHDRVRASLQYGALASPQSSVSEHQPSKDRGLQQQLLDLWFESYDTSLLMAAAQVVSGRKIPDTSNYSQPSDQASREFMKDFFVNVIDNDFVPHSTDIEIDTLHWQKVMLRSLMLIWLLDQTAEARIVDGGCLLKPCSIRKSSVAIMQTMGAVMLPACGDITRALRHLGYEVNYHQEPLDEIIYHIDNIAIDFRDGVFLTRLVEALLYPSKGDQQTNNTHSPSSSTADDFMLACEIPLPEDNSVQRTLSQCLKLPASTPVHRLCNIQVAFNALESVGFAQSTRAEDVLNGHREKTLNLLWTLITSFDGLSYLVDWKALIANMGRCPVDSAALSTPQGQEDLLLQQWASHRSGLEVKNLSTSFTSGTIYLQILKSFKPEAKADASLEELMRLRGFSESFVQSVVRSVGVVVSRNTVVCHLAVLAGNLLKLSVGK